MTDWNARIDDLIATLKQQRDELQVKIGLGKLEAREEWQALEKKLDRLLADAKAQSKPLQKATAESAKDIGSALEQVGQEIRKGYARILESLKQ
jgi:hypothetical protein